jgi:hypothetical protein
MGLKCFTIHLARAWKYYHEVLLPWCWRRLLAGQLPHAQCLTLTVDEVQVRLCAQWGRTGMPCLRLEPAARHQPSASGPDVLFFTCDETLRVHRTMKASGIQQESCRTLRHKTFLLPHSRCQLPEPPQPLSPLRLPHKPQVAQPPSPVRCQLPSPVLSPLLLSPPTQVCR